MSDIRVTVESGKTKRLLTKGKLCDKNIVVTAEGGSVDDRYDEGYDDGKQAQYDGFWDTYQQNGNRTAYRYGFAGKGWDDTTFNPKYDISPAPYEALSFATDSKITNLKQKLIDCGVTLDLSKVVNALSMFEGAEILTNLPRLDLGACTSMMNTFRKCKSLVSIDSLKLNENIAFSLTFSECSALEEIRIEGLIGKSLEIKDSPLLSADSVQSIIDHLKDLTGGTTQTLTVHGDVGAAMTPEQKAGIIAKNWTLVYDGQLTFTIRMTTSHTYAFEDGMTWQAFVDSDYNMNDAFKIEYAKVYFNDSSHGWLQVYGVVPTDVIELGATYGP